MPITVILPTALRQLAGGAARVQADASNVGELLRNLTRNYPKVRDALLAATGGLAANVKVYVNGETVEDLDGLETELQDEDSVQLVLPS